MNKKKERERRFYKGKEVVGDLDIRDHKEWLEGHKKTMDFNSWSSSPVSEGETGLRPDLIRLDNFIATLGFYYFAVWFKRCAIGVDSSFFDVVNDIISTPLLSLIVLVVIYYYWCPLNLKCMPK